MKPINCYKLALVWLFVVGHLGAAHAQQETTFSQERTLESVDEEIRELEGKQDLLRQVLDYLPSEQRVSSINIDDKLFADLDSTESQIKEYMAKDKAFKWLSDDEKKQLPENQSQEYQQQVNSMEDMWSQVRDHLKSLEKSLEAAYGSIEEIIYDRHLDERVDSERHRIQKKYGEGFDLESRALGTAFRELRDLLRDPQIRDLEEAVSSTLPNLRQQLKSIQPGFSQAFQSMRKGTELEISAIDSKLKSLRDKQKTLVNEIGRKREGQLKIDVTILTYTLPVFAGALVAILFAPYFYGAEAQKTIFASNVVLEMATVFLLTSTILILGIAEKISGEVLGTLIGGISGYVLGRWRRRDEDRPEPGKN
jgi:hypothetical protein